MVLELAIGTLGALLLFIGYILVLALRRINTYENFIIQFQQVVEYATEQM